MIRYISMFAIVALLGCSDSDPADPATTDSGGSTDVASTSTDSDGTASERKRSFKPITLGSDQPQESAADTRTPAARRLDSVIEHLKPLQVVLGNWRGTTRREFEGFKAVDFHEWVWDLKTEPEQPSLVMDSEKSPYVRQARMTWLAEQETYQLTIVSPEDKRRTFQGGFETPVQDIVGDDGKLQRTFHLLFTQTDPAEDSEQWQFAFNQVENNRYLLEVSKKRGRASFRRIDTVSTQREGTSFAVSDTDYGEKTCIISQGLGTIAVSYKGNTYWVCCTGCKAAFEEEPERWIKRAEEAKAEE